MERNSTPQLADLPFPDLLRQLSIDAGTLVRQEIALARSEVVAQITVAKKASLSVVVFAALALGAFGAATMALIEIIHLFSPLWLAALIVAIAYGTIAAAALARARIAVGGASSESPARSVESLRDDMDAVRAGIARGR